MLLILFGLGPPASAQYQKSELVISAGAGFQFPTGKFEDRVKTGAHAAAGIDYYLNPSWSLGLRASYSDFEATAESAAASGLRDWRYLNVDATAGLMLYPESWFTPYILGGIGLYDERSRQQDETGTTSQDVWRLGLVGGVGLAVHKQRSRFSLFTELIYHHIPTNLGSRQYVSWSTGIRLSFGGRPF
jgi:opacity protein-like surface antigen